MKFFAVATAAALVFASLVSAEQAAEAAPLAEFGKRACVPSACVCNHIQGQFCGTSTINPNCVKGHVYECNASTGKTCDYGLRDSCQRCNKLSCP